MEKKSIDIRENKVKEFNYKLISQICASGNLISKWNAKFSNTCDVCGEIETQIHIIRKCSFVIDVWNIISHNIGFLYNSI